LQGLRFRKIGSGLGALALIAGFAGSALGMALVTASPASADPPGTYTCTETDVQHPSITATQTGTQAVLGASASGPLVGVTVGDTVRFDCTNLAAHEGVFAIPIGGLALWDNAANEESYADIAGGNLTGSADASGTLTDDVISTNYSNSDLDVTAPPSQLAENLGGPANALALVDSTTQDPLILLEVAYNSGVGPQNPTIGGFPALVPSGSTTPVTVTTPTGYWWGAGEEGTGGASPIPNPSVTIDGTPIATAGNGDGSSTLTVSAASYAYGTPNGTPTYPVMSGGIVIPSGLAPGTHTVAVNEDTQELTVLTATTTVYVPGGVASSGTCPGGNVGPNTAVTCSGSTGWDPANGTTFTGEWIAPVGCTEGNQPATSLVAVGGAGTYSFTVNTSDLSGATFADTNCIPGSWSIDITQYDPGTPVVTGTLGPLSLVDLTGACSITGTGTCLVQQGLGQVVTGTDLTVTEYAATTGIGTPGQNPSSILVNLSPVALGPGVFQAGQGMLNTVAVNDSRGSLTGWTVTGILESDFTGPVFGNDVTIPADYLTWNPSVSLTFPGDLADGVVPFGTVAPPVYGPDACPAGTQVGNPDIGTNKNILCPVVNDNAGANNPAGQTNGSQSDNQGGTNPGRTITQTPPENHATDPHWPGSPANGPSGLIYEVQAGPIANLGTSDTNDPDYGTEPAQVLCEAASGGGGGAFNCDASLSLAVPPYVAAGHYTATMDLLTTAT